MPGHFPSAWLDELNERADIVQIVSAYVPLKKNGSRYWGLCPFHHEKTPSFSVNAEQNLYYCFGCKAGGNVIHFIQEMEHLTFAEAVVYIADQLHFPVPEAQEDPLYESRRNQRERLLLANQEAAKWYHNQLWKEENADMLAYFHRRGLNDSIIRKFGLGAAPDAWHGLADYLETKGFTPDELRTAGLTVEKNGNRYDMFRNRVIFPIIDVQSHVVGFGGRTMGDQQPKYLNTADTPVFNKRKGVFAANFLKKERNTKRIILVEGYMDVVALMQFGIGGVVATLGTALTNEQARLLKRFSSEIWVSYDGDSAGQHAIMRALDIFEQEAITARVLFFPDNLDPDEFLRQRGLEEFKKLRPLRSTEYLLMKAKEDLDLEDEEGRMEYARRSANILKRVREPIELEHYLQSISIQTGFSQDVLLRQIGAAATVNNPGHSTSEKKHVNKTTRYENDASKAEKNLITVLASGLNPADTIRAEDFDTPQLRALAEKLLNGKTPSAIMNECEDDSERQFLSYIFSNDIEINNENVSSIIDECLSTVRIRRLLKQADQIKADLASYNEEEKANAMNELMELWKEINRLKSLKK